MGTSRQALKKWNCGIEATDGSYVDNDTDVQIPFISGGIKQEWGYIQDESIVGVSFRDLPLQGIRMVTGSVVAQVDVDTIEDPLEAAFSALAGGVTTLSTTKNEKTLSMATLDEVKTNRYAGVRVNNFVLQSAAEGDLQWTADFLGWKAESRVSPAHPTTDTSAGTRLAHHHAGGTNGYVRLGDQANALAAGDNITIKDFSVGVNWNYDWDWVNAQESLAPLSGAAGRPECSCSFTIARHDVDTWLAARDARTALQMELMYYSSATANLKIQIPNVIITDVSPSEDDISRQQVTLFVARNGIGSSYSNSNMSFVDPVKVTNVNS